VEKHNTDELQTWYRGSTWSGVNQIKITKATAKQVVNEFGRREALDSDDTCIRPTFAEVKTQMVRKMEASVNAALIALNRRRDELQRWRHMEPTDGT